MSGHEFIVVQGGFIKDKFDSERRILSLNCNDGYVGLPEKVMKTFHFLISSETFDEYTHFVKLDDDMILINRLTDVNGDYVGTVHYSDGNRYWHVGRTGTFWDKIPYLGEFKPWCMGGFGYILSRDALDKITPNYDYLDHIYEDVYIGKVCEQKGIKPENFDIKKYLVSPEH